MKLTLAAAGVLALLPSLARAESPAAGSEQPGCLQAILAVQLERKLPPRLLQTIAMVESGVADPLTRRVVPWPWTINVKGAGYFYPTKQDAIDAVQHWTASGVHSVDVGCMQINLMSHPAAFQSLDEAFDPRKNVSYGAQFLGELRRQTGDWGRAVAAYHSQTPELGAEYLNRVIGQSDPAGLVGGRGLRGSNAAVLTNANRTPEMNRRTAAIDEDRRNNMARFGAPGPELSRGRGGERFAMAGPGRVNTRSLAATGILQRHEK